MVSREKTLGYRGIPMPFKNKDKFNAYRRFRRQRQKEMAHQQASTLIRDIKKNFTRGVSAGTTAEELVEDFSEVYNSPVVMNEWERLVREQIPNQPTDEVEEYFLTEQSRKSQGICEVGAEDAISRDNRAKRRHQR
jgi:hypothetical protein